MNNDALNVGELLDAFGRAHGRCTSLHQQYMGKAMPDDVYETFRTLRDERIPGLKQRLLAVIGRGNGGETGLWRHVKSGGVYEAQGRVLIESGPTDAVLYRSLETNDRWVRPVAEFMDGRFVRVEVPATPSGKEAGGGSRTSQEVSMNQVGTETRRDSLRKAAQALLDACMAADVSEDLPEQIDGSLLDAVSNALDGEPLPLPCDDQLSPATGRLVDRFAAALKEKLAEAEKKYGYSDGWARPDWMDECRQHLREHVEKGDPRDVAAYCAFLWYHGEGTTAGGGPNAMAIPPGERHSVRAQDGQTTSVRGARA